MKRVDFLFGILRILGDAAALSAAALSAYLLRFTPFFTGLKPILFELSLGRYLELVGLWLPLFLVIFALGGLYRFERRARSIEEFFHVAALISLGMMVIVFAIFFRREFFESRFIFLGAWLFAIPLVFLARVGLRQFRARLARRFGIGVRRVLLVGHEDEIRDLRQKIAREFPSSFETVPSFSEPNIREVKAALAEDIDELILTDPTLSKRSFLALFDLAASRNIAFRFVPDLYDTLTAATSFDTCFGIPVVSIKRTNLEGWGRMWKRAFDVLLAFLGLTLLLPLVPLVAAAVKLDSSGPVFVGLARVSRGREFTLWKFRSMVTNAQELKKRLLRYNERKDGPLFKMEHDPRVTRLGSWLRRYRLDELPQLCNVLTGDMSLVGPRPHESGEVARYERQDRKTLAVRAGITGLAQVSGSSDLSFAEEIRLDTYYVEHWSPLLDIKILLRTLAILSRDPSAV